MPGGQLDKIRLAEQKIPLEKGTGS